MARGRFISKEITIDKKVNSLSSPWSMLGFTWLLTHADVYGRTYGDPAVVRSMIFPRRPEVTVEEVEGFIKEWLGAGLINWYEVNGDMYIEFPNFSKHQIGLNTKKEAKSNIPPNPINGNKQEELPEIPNNIPETSGKTLETSGSFPVKLIKENLREFKGEVKENEDHAPSPAQRMIESVIGLPPGNAADMKALDEIEALNPTLPDIEAAYSWLSEQGKQVRYYSSLVGPIRTAIAKRVQKPLTPLEKSKAAILQVIAEAELNPEEAPHGIFG